MSKPVSRLARLLSEGARFTALLPGQHGIDVTPDVIATVAELGLERAGLDAAKESIRRHPERRDVPTGVQIP